MKKFKYIILFLLVMIWIVIIYLFSNMPSKESNNKSQDTIRLTIEKILDFTNGLGITNKHPSEEKIKNIVNLLNKPLRKCMHASVYFVLSILIYNFFKICKVSIWKNCILTIICSFIYACTDEYHQLFVNGRTGQFNDVLIDIAGAIIGLIFINIIFSLINKISNKKNIINTSYKQHLSSN